jgi:hypothetical protein
MLELAERHKQAVAVARMFHYPHSIIESKFTYYAKGILNVIPNGSQTQLRATPEHLAAFGW